MKKTFVLVILFIIVFISSCDNSNSTSFNEMKLEEINKRISAIENIINNSSEQESGNESKSNNASFNEMKLEELNSRISAIEKIINNNSVQESSNESKLEISYKKFESELIVNEEDFQQNSIHTTLIVKDANGSNISDYIIEIFVGSDYKQMFLPLPTNFKKYSENEINLVSFDINIPYYSGETIVAQVYEKPSARMSLCEVPIVNNN